MYLKAVNLFFRALKIFVVLSQKILSSFDLKPVHGQKVIFWKIFPWTGFKSKAAGIDGKIQQTSLKP